MKEQSRGGEKWEWSHHNAITAKGAWGWKIVSPESPQQRLSDTKYALAARLNLGLDPFPARATVLMTKTHRLNTMIDSCTSQSAAAQQQPAMHASNDCRASVARGGPLALADMSAAVER